MTLHCFTSNIGLSCCEFYSLRFVILLCENIFHMLATIIIITNLLFHVMHRMYVDAFDIKLKHTPQFVVCLLAW